MKCTQTLQNPNINQSQIYQKFTKFFTSAFEPPTIPNRFNKLLSTPNKETGLKKF
jgi:hypothetical protein